MKIDGVYVPGEGYLKTVPGTDVTKERVFAGKGTKTEFRDAPRLCTIFGGKVENWQKVRGQVVLTEYGLYRCAEIHWSQEKTVGCVKRKFKGWIDKDWWPK